MSHPHHLLLPLPPGGAPVRVSRPLPGTWRIRRPAPDGGADEPGACQELARLNGHALPAPLPAGGEQRAAFESFARERDLRLADEPGAEGAVLGGRLAPGERLYGTGERFDGAERRGKRVDIWAVDQWLETEGNSYAPVPFFMSSAGYGVLLNRFEPAAFDLGASDPARWRVGFGTAPADFYLFEGGPAEILRALADLTGHAPLPPAWSFGLFVSRHAQFREFADARGVRGMARAMERAGLPWDVAVIEGWDIFDRAAHDELGALVRELHAGGRKVLVYEACGRVGRFGGSTPCGGASAADDTRSAGEARGFTVRDARGGTRVREAASHNPGDAPGEHEAAFLDITSPAAAAWWTDEVWGPLVREIGIDGAKIDFCEQVPDGAGLRLAGDARASGWHHRYPAAYQLMMQRLFRERPEGGVCWSRGGGLGAHLYPFLWVGDQLREFPYLRAILSATLSAGLSGIPFVGHDLGAYLPARSPEEHPEAEVFLRGAQLACFGPNMQTHGKVTRPYDFDDGTVAVYRRYCLAHQLLRPYLLEQARACCESGLPLVRHLWLHGPGDTACMDCEDQYLLGGSLLVAPVLRRADARAVYLPAGAWRALTDGTPFEGPRRLGRVRAPLDTVPVFVAEPCPASLRDALPALRACLRGETPPRP